MCFMKICIYRNIENIPLLEDELGFNIFFRDIFY